jgi:broad specificity phosphatase PhoE
MYKPVTNKIVYFVRHGQSVDNVSPVFQSVHTPLSEVGLHQAQVVANRVASLQFDALIASPVLRAKQTAEAIAAKTGKQPDFSELFVERIKPSFIDGKSYEDVEAMAVFNDWEQSLYGHGPKVQDGETFAEIVARADQALAYLLDRPEDKLVVVTHGMFIRTIVARVLLGEKLTVEAFTRFQRLAAIQNTGVTVLRHQDAFEEDFAWRLWTYNDHSHFAD